MIRADDTGACLQDGDVHIEVIAKDGESIVIRLDLNLAIQLAYQLNREINNGRKLAR